MSIYKDFYDSITPEKSNEQFVSEITGAKKTNIRINPKKYAAAGIAAATAAAVTVTGYASGWNLSEIIHSWFGENEKFAINNITPVAAENITDNFSTLDFEVKGALSDDNIAVVFIDVTRTDGENFDCGEYHAADKNGEPYYHFDGKPAILTPDNIFSTDCYAVTSTEPLEIYDDSGLYEICCDNMEPVHGVKTYGVRDTNPTDNQITVAVCINKTEMPEKAEYLNLELYGFRTQKYTYSYENGHTIAEYYTTETINGHWNADITFDYAECEKLTSAPYETISLDFYNHASTPDALRHELLDFTLTELTVSPISVSLDFEAPLYDEVMYQSISDVGEVVLKNGDIVRFGYKNDIPFFINEQGAAVPPEIAGMTPYYERGEKWSFKNKYMLETPININEIDYVRIGEKIFEF